MGILEYLRNVAMTGSKTYPIRDYKTVAYWIVEMMDGNSDSLVKVYLTAYLTQPSTDQLTLVNGCRENLQHVESLFKDREYGGESEVTIQELLQNELGGGEFNEATRNIPANDLKLRKNESTSPTKGGNPLR